MRANSSWENRCIGSQRPYRTRRDDNGNVACSHCGKWLRPTVTGLVRNHVDSERAKKTRQGREAAENATARLAAKRVRNEIEALRASLEDA